MRVSVNRLPFFAVLCCLQGCLATADTVPPPNPVESLSLNGRYAPACLAMAGDSIEISNDRYVWDRFTDELVLGDDGQPVPSNPGFPKSGTVLRQGDQLTFLDSRNQPVAAFFSHIREGRQYLLSERQQSQLESSKDIWRCALLKEVT